MMTFLDKADEAEGQIDQNRVRRVLNLALQGGGSPGASRRVRIDPGALSKQRSDGHCGHHSQPARMEPPAKAPAEKTQASTFRPPGILRDVCPDRLVSSRQSVGCRDRLLVQLND